MSMTLFYRDQAEAQQRAADGAVLENVRDRCQRASNAWTDLARRSARNDVVRAATAAKRPLAGVGG